MGGAARSKFINRDRARGCECVCDKGKRKGVNANLFRETYHSIDSLMDSDKMTPQKRKTCV